MYVHKSDKKLRVAERPSDASYHAHCIFRLVTQGHARSFEVTPLSIGCV